jgi:hypothetical protein
MRIRHHHLLVIVIAMSSAACTTKATEGVCCVTAADCVMLGLDAPRPCDVGQACRAFQCVASECATSAECTSPDAPVCADNLCVASCRTDDDCAGAAGGSRCADDGACVGCFTNADCPSSAPFCDAEDRRCRGCEADAECESGVCLEMDGRCAAESEVAFVSSVGQDLGECSRAMPCASIVYASTKLQFPTRLVIHVAGGQFTVADMVLDSPIYIDGTNTSIGGDGSGPYVHVTSSMPVTLSNLTIDPASGPAVTAAADATLRIYNSSIHRGVETTGGTIIAARSRFAAATGATAVKCTSGTVAIDGCHFTSIVHSTNCQMAVSSSVFDLKDDRALSASGRITLENNLFIQSYELADSVTLVSNAPGSRVRFNTFVNTSTVASDGVALYCDATLEVTSNIFAYGSLHPHGISTCSARYSLYDTVALPEQTDGVGNRVAAGATFFADKANRSFHLAPASPARGAAELGTGVTRDLEGRRRPSPIGSAPDMGAFEAP